MNAKAFAELREIADAIDTLQDKNVLGDTEADQMFINHLKDIEVTLEEYWEYYGESPVFSYKYLT